MIKTVMIDEREYKIDTNPPKPRLFATVKRITSRKDSGALIGILADITGKEMIIKDEIKIDKDEEKSVVLSLGRKFSVSKKWQMLVDYYDYWMEVK